MCVYGARLHVRWHRLRNTMATWCTAHTGKTFPRTTRTNPNHNMIDNMSHDACQSRFCSPSLCLPLFAIPSDFIFFIHISSMVDRFYSTKMYAFTCGRYQKKCLPLGDVDIESLGSLQRAWHATWLGLAWFDSINIRRVFSFYFYSE